MSNITLLCLIQCDNPDNIFEIEIKSSDSIGDLNEKIKKKKQGFFDNVNIIKLWKVGILFGENDKFNILKTNPCASIKKFEGEELDTTKKVSEYFSRKFSDKKIKKIHIIVQRERINVAIFGLTGHGKSSVANMLIQGDIYREDNKFKVDDSAKGVTTNISFSTNEIFNVFDTIGLGESPSSGSISHNEAVKRIREYFPTCEILFNYLFYVKKKGRFTDNDVKKFNSFKTLCGDGEKNFVIIITDCNPEWVKSNLDIIKNNFGDYPIIPVDFPWNEEEEDDDAQYNQKKRAQSLRFLLDELFRLRNKGIRLEVLNSFQYFCKLYCTIS